MADESDNIAAALLAIAEAIQSLAESTESVAMWIKYLGNGDAATPMGAIEGLGKVIGEAADTLAASVDSVAGAIEGGKS